MKTLHSLVCVNNSIHPNGLPVCPKESLMSSDQNKSSTTLVVLTPIVETSWRIDDNHLGEKEDNDWQMVNR